LQGVVDFSLGRRPAHIVNPEAWHADAAAQEKQRPERNY